MKVIAGRDKGKTGKVISVDRWRGKVLVEGVSMIKRHTRPNPQQADQGRNRREGKPDLDFERDGAHLRRRAHARGLQDGRPSGTSTRRVRIAKKSGEALDKRA